MAEMIIRASVGEGDSIVVGFNKEEQQITTEVRKKEQPAETNTEEGAD